MKHEVNESGFVLLSEEAKAYCMTMYGVTGKGCGFDYEYCKNCRSCPKTKEQLNEQSIFANEYVTNLSEK